MITTYFTSKVSEFIGQPCLADSQSRLVIFSNRQATVLAEDIQKKDERQQFLNTAGQVQELAWVAKAEMMFVEIEKGQHTVEIEYPEDCRPILTSTYPKEIYGARISEDEAVFSYRKWENTIESTGLFLVKGRKRIDLSIVLPILTFAIWVHDHRLYIAGMEARIDYFTKPLLYTLSLPDEKVELLDLKPAEDQALQDALALFPERQAELMLKHKLPIERVEGARKIRRENFIPETWIASTALTGGRLLALGIAHRFFAFFDPEYEYQFSGPWSHTGIALYVMQEDHTLSFLDAFSPCFFYALVELGDAALLFIQEYGESDDFLEEIVCVRIDKNTQSQGKYYIHIAEWAVHPTRVTSFKVIAGSNDILYAILEFYDVMGLKSSRYLASQDGISWTMLDQQVVDK